MFWCACAAAWCFAWSHDIHASALAGESNFVDLMWRTTSPVSLLFVQSPRPLRSTAATSAHQLVTLRAPPHIFNGVALCPSCAAFSRLVISAIGPLGKLASCDTHPRLGYRAEAIAAVSFMLELPWQATVASLVISLPTAPPRSQAKRVPAAGPRGNEHLLRQEGPRRLPPRRRHCRSPEGCPRLRWVAPAQNC